MKNTFLFLSLCCILVLCAGCGAQPPEEEIPVSADASLMRAGVVYLSDGTTLIPVRVSTALDEDTPAQLMTCLRDTEVAGLSSVLPQDAQMDVSVSDGIAHIALTGSMSTVDGDAAVCAIVNTLTQCENIKAVQLSVNGLSETLGAADLTQPIAAVCLNPAYEIGEHEAFRVFFQNESGLVVPVTKETNNPSAEVFIRAMMTVPEKYPALSSLFPAGTKLNSAVLTDGTLSLDFSGEFYGISALPEAEEKLLTAIDATCKQLDRVSRVIVSVDGVEYATSAQSVGVFANDIVA